MILTPPSGTSWPATVGTPFNQSITVSGGQLPYTNTQCTPTSCRGLNLNCTNTGATISGTPNSPGTCTFNTAWQDSCANPGPQTIIGTYTVNISAQPCPPFTGWTQNLPSATNCQPYSGSITVLGGVPPYTWQLSSGSLPNGINFCTGNTSATCNLAGTPSATPQTYNFTVTVRDSCQSGPQSTSQEFSITVIADSCSSGIQVMNQSRATRYYRKNGGACTSWPYRMSITVSPVDSYLIFANSACTPTALYCPNPITYCQQKAYDQNGDCITQMGPGCSFSD